MNRDDRRFLLGLALVVVALACGAYLLAPEVLDPAQISRYHQTAQKADVVGVYSSPLFWGLLALTLVLERWMPAVKGQPMLSKGFVHDFVYFVIIVLFRVLVLSVYVQGLRWLYDSYLSFLTVDAVAYWPGWAKAVIGVAITDFLGWFHHMVRHKVPWFWRLHAVHHSQRELNLFTDVRYHPFEYLISQTIQALPMFMFDAALPVVVAYGFFQHAFTKFYHGNLRTNLGPLRFVLVTPQSHRIHHSARIEHRDQNYGVVFSIWDRMFGTLVRDATSYPATGIDDPTFPHEMSIRGLGLLRGPWRQFLYPFKRRRA